MSVFGILLQVLLTSFEILMKDQNTFAKEIWPYIIVDEAHRSQCSSYFLCKFVPILIPDDGILHINFNGA